MRWSDELFWDLDSKPRSANLHEEAVHLPPTGARTLLYEDYVARCVSLYGIRYIPAILPNQKVLGSRDGLFTHIRAFGPKVHQWEIIRRHDPVGLAVWTGVKACTGPCRVVWNTTHEPVVSASAAHLT